MSQSQVTQSCNTEKVIKDFEIDNIIQYSSNMLALWKVYKYKGRSVVVCIQTTV